MKNLSILFFALFFNAFAFAQNPAGGDPCAGFSTALDSLSGTDCSTAAHFSMTGAFPMTLTTSWSTGSGNPQTVNASPFVLNNFCPESYTVIITDANGCIDTLLFDVGAFDPCDAFSVSIDSVGGTGGCDSDIYFNIQNATFPVSVQTFWSTGGGGINTASSSPYMLPDFCPESYNVVFTDNGGCMDSLQFSIGQVGITALQQAEKVLLYPNPANESIFVDFGENPIPTDMELYAADGRLINHYTSNQEKIYNIATHNLAPGLYYLRFRTDKMSFTKHFVKH